MTQIKVGQVAPAVNLEKLNGERISLAEFWQDDHHTLLIFLRHLA